MKDERINPDGSITVGILSDTKEWVTPEVPKEEEKKPTKKKKAVKK